MELARVVGTVVATRKEPRLEGFKILLTQLAGPDGTATGGAVVALDSVGAGEGELVLLVRGSSARLACEMESYPVDAVILGIVDRITVDGRSTFLKEGAGAAG
jgi:ethanolamine utilization protein EutN